MDRNFTAILVNWSMFTDRRIDGTIFSDESKRFADGEGITTSTVEKILRTSVGPVAHTSSGSRYLLM